MGTALLIRVLARGIVALSVVVPLLHPRGVWAAELSLEPCHECHMPWGQKHEAGIPLTYGQPRAYLRRMLARFKARDRASVPMSEVTSRYSDSELDRLAELMAAHVPVRIEQKTDADKVARGGVVYRDRCMVCHTEEGRESEFDAPLLAGQPIEYLRKQMRSIYRGERDAHYMMMNVYRGLKPEDLDALAHFFASRQR